jgi:hypothetical protein
MLLGVLQSTWITAVAIPAFLVYMQGALKAASRPKGPFPLAFFLRPSRIRHSDRALGLDLLFAAAGSELSFLASYALRGSAPVIEPKTRKLFETVGISLTDKAQVAYIVLATIMVCLVVVAGMTRWRGHIKTDGDQRDLKEEFVTAPNMLGILLLLVVWGLA